MYRAIELSKYIVSKCIEDGQPISNLQLQKILYYIQREFLKKNGIAAFADETEAWQFGPVVPDVYYYYCGYGAMPISFVFGEIEIKDEDMHVIDPIVEEKRSKKPWTLVAETHKKNGAWDQIYKNGEGNHQVIPTALIKAVG